MESAVVGAGIDLLRSATEQYEEQGAQWELLQTEEGVRTFTISSRGNDVGLRSRGRLL